MADRRPPGFNVPLGFYDGPEVKSIPRRIRAAAVGVWTLCGTFSANKLQDGYVGPEDLKHLGCTAAIRAALKATLGPDGAPDPLWIDARGGGIQFTKWVKYQRSRAEVKHYREADAQRKRAERKAAKPPPTSDDTKMSARTFTGHPPDHRNPRVFDTKTETKDFGYLPESATESTARDPSCHAISATPAADLVRKTIPANINDSIQTQLRLTASQLLKAGEPADVVEEALADWATKTGVGPGILPSLAADVVKRRNGHARAAPAGKPTKIRTLAELAEHQRAAEAEAEHHNPRRKELT